MIDKPNIIHPLIATQNERGIKGHTNQARDQIKINSMYEPVTSITGQTALNLVNRPGITSANGISFGSGTRPYLITPRPGATADTSDNTWLFYENGNDINVTVGGAVPTTQLIATSASHVPTYTDLTRISGTETIVLQTRTSTGAHRAFFSSAIATWTEITDAAFTGLNIVGKAEHMDGFMFVLTTNDRIKNSNINSLANWNTNKFITKQIKQDASRGLARFGQQLLAFGGQTMEVFRNAGNEGSPLEAVPSMFKNYGIPLQTNSAVAMSHYYATLGEMMYFVGIEKSAKYVGAYAYNGERVEKISNPFIEKLLSEDSISTPVTGIWSIVIGGQNAIAFHITATDASTAQWWMYFPALKEWFYWTSTAVFPINSGRYFLGVGSRSDNVLDFDNDTENYFDDGDTVTMEHQFKLGVDTNAYKTLNFLSVIGDTPTGSGSLMVAFSTDDGSTYGTARAIDMQNAFKILRKCGSFKGNIWVKFTWAVNRQLRLEKVLGRIN